MMNNFGDIGYKILYISANKKTKGIPALENHKLINIT